MAIGFYNFAELHSEEFRKQIKERISSIVDKNAFIEGEYNVAFEKEFAKMQGAKHAHLVANGTDAIEIALIAYGIGKDDLVGIPGISFFATAEAVVNIGAKPVFIDIDPATGLMDPASLKRVLQKHKLKAIVPVHIYGQPAPIKELETICIPLNIKIVEDGAQAQGTFLPNGPVGSSKNLATFSFYPTKNLGAFGDAGAVLTNNDALSEKIVSIRNHGRSPQGHKLFGRNSRCDSIQAAVLHLKLENVERYNKTRKEVAKKYHEQLKNVPIRIAPASFIESSSWHLYPIGLSSREQKYALKDFLQKNEIGPSLFYEKSMAEELPLQGAPGEFTKAIEFAANTLCIPIHPFLKDDEIKTVANKIKEFLKNNS